MTGLEKAYDILDFGQGIFWGAFILLGLGTRMSPMGVMLGPFFILLGSGGLVLVPCAWLSRLGLLMWSRQTWNRRDRIAVAGPPLLFGLALVFILNV